MAEKSISPILQDRVQKAAQVMKITDERVWLYLAELGIEQDDEDALALLDADTTREGDARRVFESSSDPVKPARFVAGWQVLKGRTAEKKVITEDVSNLADLVEAIKPIGKMKDRELLERYGPDAPHEIVRELLDRSHGRPFVIYKEDNATISMDNTLLMLRTARRQETKQFMVITRESGSTEEVRVYRADEFPMVFVDECPSHPGVVLTQGYCDKCQNTWSGISVDDRVIIRLARDAGVIKCDSVADTNELITRVRKDGAKYLLDTIPSLARQYRERQEDNLLPRLQKRLSTSSNGKLDPLNQHKRY